MTIKKHDQVQIKPEWQDEGDDQFTWIALEDQDGENIIITPIDSKLTIKPQYLVRLDMLVGH